MKTLVIFLVLAFATAAGNAQELIELQEARVNYNPLSSSATKVGNAFSYTVVETYRGEFEKDPLGFVKKHFDIQQIINEFADNNYSSYEISFKSRKGSLLAEYDQNGKLVSTSQKFKNIALPNIICHQLFREHKGWAMVDNAHIAKSRNGKIKQNYYRITMQNGNKKRNVKIDAMAPVSNALVSK